MPMKAIIAHQKSLPSVEAFQTDLGLVQCAKDEEQGDLHFLTGTEVGRLAGLPGAWSMKGYYMNLLAKAAGLVMRVNGRWAPTKQGESHGRRVDGRWRWFPSVVRLIQEASKEFPLDELRGRVTDERDS
jgi:hypothetical protein